MLELLEEEGFFLTPLWEFRDSNLSSYPTIHQAWLLVRPGGRAFLRAYSNRWANGIEFLRPCCAFARGLGLCKKCSADGSFITSRTGKEQLKTLEEWLEGGASPLGGQLFFGLVQETFRWALEGTGRRVGDNHPNPTYQALLEGQGPSLAPLGLPLFTRGYMRSLFTSKHTMNAYRTVGK